MQAKRVVCLIALVIYPMHSAFSMHNGIAPMATIIAALNTLKSNLPGSLWKTETRQQQQLIKAALPSTHPALERFEIESESFGKLNEAETFLQGLIAFPAALEKKKGKIYAVALMEAYYGWQAKTNADRIVDQHSSYPVVVIKGAEGFEMMRAPWQLKKDTAIALQTSDGDNTIKIAEIGSLIQKLRLIQHDTLVLETYPPRYTSITERRIPQIDLDYQPDISWLLQGLHIIDNQEPIMKNFLHHPLYIQHAQQRIRFQIDEKGAFLQSAVAITSGYEKELIAPTLPPESSTDPIFEISLHNAHASEPLFIKKISLDQCKKPLKF